MLKNGGLVIVADRAYIVSPQRSTGNLFPMPESKYSSPSGIALGDLSRIIREYRIDTTALIFAVSYVMPDKKTVIPVESTTFDSNLHRRQILEKVTSMTRQRNFCLTSPLTRQTASFPHSRSHPIPATS